VQQLDTVTSIRAGWPPGVRSWVVLFVPSLFVVLIQEMDTPFPNGGFAVISALCQHATAGLVLIPLAVLRRRNGYPVALWVDLVAWSIDALCRGVIGGAVAAVFTHSGPDFGHRILVWLMIAWVWGPLVSYVGAQRQHRSQLLEEIARAEKRRKIARQRAERSTEEVREQILDVMRKVVRPALEESRTSLLMAHPPPSIDEMRSIAAHLTRAIVATRDAVEQLPPPAPAVIARVSPLLDPQVHASPFKRRRTMLRLTLAAMADGALAVPFFRSPHDAAAALTVSVVLLPVCAGLSVGVVSAAFNITEVNHRLISSLHAVEADEVTQVTVATAKENEVRIELESVVHGPIMGRLSACVMAISFYLTHEAAAVSPQAFNLTSAVLSHLDAVRHDLTSLAKPDGQD
jgi:hypothetical protein